MIEIRIIEMISKSINRVERILPPKKQTRLEKVIGRREMNVKLIICEVIKQASEQILYVFIEISFRRKKWKLNIPVHRVGSFVF